MKGSAEHWNRIFSATAEHRFGWYEKDSCQTLKFLDLLEADDQPMVFLSGAGTSQLVDDLLAGGYRLVVNDISDEALARLKARHGGEPRLTWLCHDIARPLPEDLERVDIWIDRAVLHFLLDKEQIAGYFANLRSALKPGGYALLAEFSPLAVPKCAGLDLHLYSLEEMTQRLGEGFELISHENYTYISPFGDPRPYIYALYRKSAEQPGTDSVSVSVVSTARLPGRPKIRQPGALIGVLRRHRDCCFPAEQVLYLASSRSPDLREKS